MAYKARAEHVEIYISVLPKLFDWNQRYQYKLTLKIYRETYREVDTEINVCLHRSLYIHTYSSCLLKEPRINDTTVAMSTPKHPYFAF